MEQVKEVRRLLDGVRALRDRRMRRKIRESRIEMGPMLLDQATS
jgi:hypothetical protein